MDPPTATVGYLSQEHVTEGAETVRAVLQRRTGVAAAEADLADAAPRSRRATRGRATATRTPLARYEAISAGDFEGRLVAAVERVALPAASVDQPLATLSGGQQARAALAAILLARFDVTLLDEPTNDLDFDGLSRLEDLVARRSGGIVIVSHDRAFLDRTVTEVLELDEHTHTGRAYGGGWAGYRAEREAEQAHAAEAYAVYEAQRAELRRRAQRERQWATTGVAREKKRPRDDDKAQRDFRVNRTERLAARARRTERAIEVLDEVEKPWEGWDLRFRISEAARSGDVVVRLEDAVIERGGFTLGPLTLDIAWADRVALVGPNGSGKTTLVEALLGRLPLAQGRGGWARASSSASWRRTARVLRDGGSVADAFMAATGLSREHARVLSWPSSGWAPVPCSGRRRHCRRANAPGPSWPLFAAKGVNLLVLDEPTNHLDLPAIEELEDTLRGYSGTLLLVSHDRRLLESVPLTARAAAGTRSGVPGSARRRVAPAIPVTSGAKGGSHTRRSTAPRSQPRRPAASPRRGDRVAKMESDTSGDGTGEVRYGGNDDGQPQERRADGGGAHRLGQPGTHRVHLALRAHQRGGEHRGGVAGCGDARPADPSVLAPLRRRAR